MRILLDECVPRGLKRTFGREHAVFTVPEAGFAGLKNGELLRRASGTFDLFITTDKNLRHQQNLPAYAMGFILIRARSNDISDIEPLVPQLLALLPATEAGRLLIVG